MIIGIDISSIPYSTGVSNYTLNLIKNLVKTDKNNIYKLFYSSLRLPLPKEILSLKRYPNIKIYHYRLPPTLLEIIWNQLRLFPIELFIGKCDIFHTSDWTQPPTISTKTITTVHDLTPFLYPKWHHPKVVKAHHHKMYWASKKCSHFICVSQNTKTDLLKLFPNIQSQNISVIYEAAEEKYVPQKEKNKENIKKKYNLGDFILAQGTREPRKNLKRLIEAFSEICNPEYLHRDVQRSRIRSDISLAITGKYGWGEDIKHLQNNKIKILGFIPEEDMVLLHASALCLVYPSLYEGFGLPLVKSMKVGTPIITSNTSCLPEVAGDAALLVDPKSVKSISEALKKIINSPSLRKELSQKGLIQAQKFSWTKTAQETLKVYEKVC